MRALLSRLGEMGNTLAGFVYPEVCEICGEQKAGPSQSYVCGECRRRVTRVREPFCTVCGLPFDGAIQAPFKCWNCAEQTFSFQWARSAVTTRGTALEAVHRFKYNQALWLEPFLVELLLEAAVPQLETASWDAIIPVPLYPAKQRERGFNQSERLARHLAQAAGIPLQTQWLRRTRPTKTQTRLTRAERQHNLNGAFQCTPRAELKGKRVVLVDDVFTTGSTTDACAKEMVQSGADCVCVWTLARGI